MMKLLLIITTIFLWGFTISQPKTVDDFKLKNTDGQWVSLNNYPDAKGFIIVFTCNHCPFAKQYPQRLNALSNKYKALGIPLLAISSTDTLMYAEDTYDKMIEIAKQNHFDFPYLQDNTQSVGKKFGAQKTPHAFVIWKENTLWKIKYSGAIDDNGGEPNNVIHDYVSEAVNSLLDGKKVAITETKSIGCQIHYRNQ